MWDSWAFSSYFIGALDLTANSKEAGGRYTDNEKNG